MKIRTEQTKADGFLNIVIVDNSGNRHSFKMGIPLYFDRKLDAKLLDDPEALSRLKPEQIELQVHVIKESSDPDF